MGRLHRKQAVARESRVGGQVGLCAWRLAVEGSGDGAARALAMRESLTIPFFVHKYPGGSPAQPDGGQRPPLPGQEG